MKNILLNLRLPAIISSVLLLPFLILELINRGSFNQAFPFSLFAVLWLLPVTFILTLTSIVHSLRVENGIKKNLPSLFLKAALFILTAGLWVAIILDQMPCFLGVPNCD